MKYSTIVSAEEAPVCIVLPGIARPTSKDLLALLSLQVLGNSSDSDASCAIWVGLIDSFCIRVPLMTLLRVQVTGGVSQTATP